MKKIILLIIILILIFFINCASEPKIKTPEETIDYIMKNYREKKIHEIEKFFITKIAKINTTLIKKFVGYKIKKIVYYDKEKINEMKKQLKIKNYEIINKLPKEGDVEITVTCLFENDKSYDFWNLLRKYDNKWLIVDYGVIEEP